MKKLILIILTLPLLSFVLNIDDKVILGTWELNQITLNKDTIFYRGQFEYTLKHNFELNKNWITNHEDSLIVIKRAEQGFHNSNSIHMEFLTDSTFKMTKIRSGGRINPDEFDFGTYEITTDTLLMTNQSRQDYKMMLKIDLENGRIYQEDGLPNYMVYQEYLRKN